MMATYAACVWHMDKAIGTLVSALKERGELDNTLILFMSDNGGNAEGGPNGTTKGEPTQPDSNWFSGQSWAWLQNTPFREYKHYTHEGGISTPLIAHWPKGIPANRNGAWESQPGHLVDIMATVVDVGGASYPSGEIKPKEGVSLRPAFAGKPLADGKIKLDLPSIAENGLVVPLNFDIESPMTENDYVKNVYFFAEGNPNPVVAAFHFTALTPKASGQIRIRLAQTQNIVAVAEMADGKLYTAKKEVKVTIGGCGG